MDAERRAQECRVEGRIYFEQISDMRTLSVGRADAAKLAILHAESPCEKPRLAQAEKYPWLGSSDILCVKPARCCVTICSLPACTSITLTTAYFSSSGK
jgi:hypothetical protein